MTPTTIVSEGLLPCVPFGFDKINLEQENINR